MTKREESRPKLAKLTSYIISETEFEEGETQLTDEQEAKVEEIVSWNIYTI